MNTATKIQLLRTFNIFVHKPIANEKAKEEFGRVLQYQEAIEILAKRGVPKAVIEQACDAVEIRLERTTWKSHPRIAISTNI